MNNSYLMVAGDKQNHLDKLDILKCHKAIVNLEDGVYDKKFARNLVYKNLLNKNNKNIIVRVNSLHSCGKKDIKLINKIKPYAIRIPKVKTKKDVKKALKLINKDIKVHISIETKEAFYNIRRLKVNNRVTTVYLGILDLLESLKLKQNLLKLNNPTIDFILSKFLLDSKSVGFKSVGFVYQEYQNIKVFKCWCKKEKSLGYDAKACISLKQVNIVNKIYKNKKKSIKKAKYIIKKFEEKLAKGISGFKDKKYGFIDEPIYKDAKLILSK